MEELVLVAIDRADGKFRESGFVPGVLYGDGVDQATSVKFEEGALEKLIRNHGNSAKVWVELNGSKKFGFIKDVQRKHLTRKVAHIDVQIVSTDHEVNQQIPIVFIGEETLKPRQLRLQVFKPEVTVFGKMALVPDKLEINVTEMNVNDEITMKNFTLDKNLRIENEDDVIATISYVKTIAAEVVEPAEAETKTDAKAK